MAPVDGVTSGAIVEDDQIGSLCIGGGYERPGSPSAFLGKNGSTSDVDGPRIVRELVVAGPGREQQGD